MSTRRTLITLALSALLASCGGSGSHKHAQTEAASLAPTRLAAHAPAPRVSPPRVQALVTAETENRVLVVDLPSGHVVRRIPVAPDPEDLATSPGGGEVVVVSSNAGKVTLLSGETLRPLKTLGGFEQPHIAAIAPDGEHAYVTDDARGTLTAIDLATLRETGTTLVGAGAHHMSFDPVRQLGWVALGESATTIVILNTQDFNQPKVIGRFDPGFEVHDLAFSSTGNRVWATSANRSDVTVFDATDQHVLFRVPAGPPPQHVALAGAYAYLTSGYGSTIERVDARTGRILAKASSPYGSFELAADARYVVVSSLLRGTLAIYTPGLKLLRVVHLAPATREVALASPAGTQRATR